MDEVQMNEVKRALQQAATILAQSKRATAFCGAGVSAESEIATFRDPGGLWDKMDPTEVGTAQGLMHAILNKTDELIPIFEDLLDTFEKADRNPGHDALKALEDLGILQTVITQNVDNLHWEAGNREVIEMHGNLFRMRCLACGIKQNVERKQFVRTLRKKLKSLTDYSPESLLEMAPICEACGSYMRPDVVLFGEAVHDLPRSFNTAAQCDAMLVLGTSGTVYPAALLPLEAKKAGARIIVINPREDAFRDLSDVYIPQKSGEALPSILEFIENIST